MIGQQLSRTFIRYTAAIVRLAYTNPNSSWSDCKCQPHVVENELSKNKSLLDAGSPRGCLSRSVTRAIHRNIGQIIRKGVSVGSSNERTMRGLRFNGGWVRFIDSMRIHRLPSGEAVLITEVRYFLEIAGRVTHLRLLYAWTYAGYRDC